ncbi:kinase-like domain-containing protein [Scheffersomyces xylosifermentans]|uniref:kinase-like domain-containing protein n=1 Tax=Scheffersomyces xylosifermentans TaxID=1304137 RepID=UPI00315D5900
MYLDGYMMNDDLKFIKKIGAGTYGLIYLVEDITTGIQYAAKMVLKDPPSKQGSSKDSNENKKYIQQKIYNHFATQQRVVAEEIDLNLIQEDGVHCPFLKEIALHLRVHQHPNVISIHKVLNLGETAIVILMDYFEQGDLFNNIIENQIFLNHKPEHHKQLLMKNVMLQLVEVIDYCQEQGVYHCDLKPENIMVSYNKNYKRKSAWPLVDYNEIHIVLIDFGLAMSSNLICCNACRGSSFYMAPERTTNYNTNRVIRGLVDMKQYKSVEINNTTVTESNSKYFPTLMGDIWSLGVLFINVTCARNPWPIASFNEAHGSNDVFRSYMLDNNKNILSSILPISFQFNRLLDKIFQINPNDRIPLPELYKEIIKCDFFHDFKKKSTHTKTRVNTQLNTPPETEACNSFVNTSSEENCRDELSGDEDEYSVCHYYKQEYPKQVLALETPENSLVYMEQCEQQQVKTFNCV